MRGAGAARHLSLALAALGALGVGGCGEVKEAAIPSEAPPPASTQVTPTASEQPQEPTRPAEEPGSSKRKDKPGPTRLIGEPLIYRVTDAPKPTGSDSTPQLKYVFIFRLSRDPYEADFERRGNDTKRGRFSVLGSFFNDEVGIFLLGPRSDRCFAGYVDTVTLDPLLERIKPGEPVETTLQPLTRSNGRVRLGRRYEKSPPMRTTPFTISDGPARSQLRRLGCRTASLL